ncbi:MAG TPA: hypothetical protein VF821_01900, partial [Lentzea sp.]
LPGGGRLHSARDAGGLMYSWIWRHLPGPLYLRIIEAVVLTAGIIALLMFVVFPWAEPKLPFNHVTTQ